MTHSIHKESDILQIYFCVIFCETRHHTWAHATSSALCSLFGRENTYGRAVGWFRWLFFVMATSAEAGCCCSSSTQNSLLTSLAFAPDSEVMSATRISLMAFSSGFIYFFTGIAQDPQPSDLFRLLCMTGHSFRNVIRVRYERLLQWQQNRCKATMW